MPKSIETFTSLEQRLQDVRKKFDLHLNKSYLTRLLDGIDESDHTRVVLQAVIMILGYNYMSDRTLHIVFEKESTIKRIKAWNKCKLQKHKVLRIKNWMEFRPQTFGEASGYKGDKLLHALRDWCIIMVANKTKVTKKITNEEREIKTLRGSLKNSKITTAKPSDNKLKIPSQSEMMTKKATMPKPESVAMTIRVSKVEKTEKEQAEEKKDCEIKKKCNKLRVSVQSERVSKKAKAPKSEKENVSKKDKKSKSDSKAVQCKTLTMDKAVSSTITSNNHDVIKADLEDKSVGYHIAMKTVAVQTAPKHTETTRRKIKCVAKTMTIRNNLRGIVDNLDENFNVLSQAKEQLVEARKDLNRIKSYRKRKNVRKNDDGMSQTEWNQRRDYFLQKIRSDQEILMNRLKSSQLTFFD